MFNNSQSLMGQMHNSQVSCDKIDRQGLYVEDPINNPPQKLIQTYIAMDEFEEVYDSTIGILGLLLTRVQQCYMSIQNNQPNYPEIYYYNRLSFQNFDNQEWRELCGEVLAATGARILNGEDMESAARRSIKVIYEGKVSKLISGNDNLKRVDRSYGPHVSQECLSLYQKAYNDAMRYAQRCKERKNQAMSSQSLWGNPGGNNNDNSGWGDGHRGPNLSDKLGGFYD
jgi:hypothetical protein